MTSLTGSTAQKYKGSGSPPNVVAAVGGAVAEFAVLGYVWSKSTAVGNCFPNPTAPACMDDPWARQVMMTLALCLALWAYSLRTIPSTGTSDPSIVDRCWSILPWMYAWHFYVSAPTSRGLLMAVLSTIWGVRLTANFVFKGGYSGGEDYRWKEIRSWPGFVTGWEVFNLTFICGFQQFVCLAFVAPAAAVTTGAMAAQPLNSLDLFAAALYVLLVGGEALADHQMYIFQTEKYRRIGSNEPLGPYYGRGFVHNGLWAYSRHPNYFCEVTMWWVFYLFTIAAGMPLLNWTVLGPIFLSCLFVLPHASLDVTELLSSRKYADYPTYQNQVSKFLPLPPRPANFANLPPLPFTDKLLVGWFVLGAAITYLIDMEQVLIDDPSTYGTPGAHTPIWPPTSCVHAIHWWGRTADHLVLARPTWYKIAIWLEVYVQAPFYVLAILAFLRQQSFIRLPAIIYSTVLLTIMPIVLGEQYYGPHRTEQPLLVTAVYGAYVVMPILVLLRVRHPDVFPPTPAATATALKSQQEAKVTQAASNKTPPRRRATSPSAARSKSACSERA